MLDGVTFPKSGMCQTAIKTLYTFSDFFLRYDKDRTDYLIMRDRIVSFLGGIKLQIDIV